MPSRLREFYSAVVERNTVCEGACTSEPYEAGWASEAIVFVRVLGVGGEHAALRLAVEISPDGICWCPEGTALPEIRGEGLYFARVRHFGNWLRVAGSADGGSFRVLLYWALKE